MIIYQERLHGAASYDDMHIVSSTHKPSIHHHPLLPLFIVRTPALPRVDFITDPVHQYEASANGSFYKDTHNCLFNMNSYLLLYWCTIPWTIFVAPKKLSFTQGSTETLHAIKLEWAEHVERM
jgi:hypothetical protein